MPANQSQRPKFYEEQYLGAADLTAAVDYSRVQQARHALGAHTWGIAIGLQLKETPQPGGSGAVRVHLLPGYAWDGYGRPIVVLAPYKIPEELFSSIKFNSGTDADGKGRLIQIWLRYDETATQNPRLGFEVCDVIDQQSRIQETFRLVISEQNFGVTDRSSGITIAAKLLPDAKTALKTFDTTAPLVYDESIPQQTFPEPQDRARWLIPIGYVRWLPVQSGPGSFVARDDKGVGGAEKDSDKIRRVRRYIGVVTEEIEAADGAIRLRDRSKDPQASFFQAPLTVTDPKNPPVNDLVWVEGHLRVLGDARLAGGKLDFRDEQGNNFNTPLAVQRANDGSALRLVIGRDTHPTNRLAVGPLKTSDNSFDEKFVVLSNGNVGIGTAAPTQLLTFSAPEGNRLEIGRTSPSLPWNSTTPARPGAFVINQQSQGVSGPGAGADFALMRDRKKRLTLLDSDTNLSSQNGGSLRFFVNYDEPPGSQEALTITGTGNVGIGTTTPTHKFHVLAQEAVGLFESTTATQAYLRLATSEGLNNRVEITNRQGGRLSLFTSGAGDAFNITRSGNVGIGTISPATKLHVLGNRIRLEGSNKRIDIRADGSSVDLHSETNHLYVRSSGPGGNNNVIINPFPEDGNVGIGTETPNEKLHVQGNLRVENDLYVVGQAYKWNGFTWTVLSDERLKEKITSLNDALSKLLQLHGVSFFWRSSKTTGNVNGPHMGLIAQQVEKVFPEWVSTTPDGYKALTMNGFEALTIEALRELHGEIEALKKHLNQFTKNQPTITARPRTRKGGKESTHETRN